MNRIITLFTINKIVMKKIRLTLVVATVVILFFFSGCDKDIRDKYTGDWEFVTEKQWQTYKGGVIITTKCDTLYYTGSITSGSSEHELLIQYTKSDVITTFIDKKGGIYVPSCPCAGYACTRGDFEGENRMNLHFGFNWDYQENREVHKIVGTKKERR